MSLPWRYHDGLQIITDDEGEVILELDPESEEPIDASEIDALGNWIATCGPAVLGLTMPPPDPHLTLIAELISLLDRMADSDAAPVYDTEYDAFRERARKHLADHGLTPARRDGDHIPDAGKKVPAPDCIAEARRAALNEVVEMTIAEVDDPGNADSPQYRTGVRTVGAFCRSLLKAIP